MPRSMVVLGLAASLALAAAGSASAAPAATLSLADGGTSVFNWTGGPGNGILSKAYGLPNSLATLPGPGVKCGDPTADCVDKLVKVDDVGDLTFDVKGDPGSPLDQSADPTGQVRYDIDAYLFASDASGAVGEQLAKSGGSGYNEQIVLHPVDPGYYVLRVTFYEAVQGSFHASAALTPYVPDSEEDDSE